MNTDSVRLSLKVVPGSSRSAIVGWMGDALKVKVAAPPEKGKANIAVTALLTQVLELPRGAVQIVAGDTSPHKVVEITGLTETVLNNRLSEFGNR